MSTQDCPNCHYPAPSRKQDKVDPKGAAPAAAGDEECPQCFYQPEGGTEPQTEECAQCFYQPEEEPKKDEGDDCSQCFYKPQ